ncbi:MAG: prolyl oligopeptidase family serine peptidase [Vicinamibacterales bacterium]
MRVGPLKRLILAVGLALAVARPSAEQATPAPKTLDVADYLHYETPADPRISPDATQIVYTRRWVNRMEDKMESALWVMNADGTKNRFLAKGSNAVWSPDGTRIAYIAEGEPKGAQIFVRWMDGEGAPSQVTQVEHAPADIDWSPDGKQLGFTMLVPKTSTWEIPMPKPPEGAHWTKAPAVIDRLHYRQDRKGYTEPGFTHLFVVPSDGGTPRALTSGDWNVGARFDGMSGAVGWDWSPDGRTIVVDGLDRPDADLRYRDSDIFAIDVATASLRKLIAEPGSWATPEISPDGRLVAFTGHADTKASYQSAELYVVGFDATGVRKISGTLDRDVGNLQWAADGSGVYFTADDRGTSNVHFAPLSGAVRSVTTGTHMLSLSGPPAKDTAVGVRSAPHLPPDVVRFNLSQPGTPTQITRLNEDLLAGVTLGEVEEIRYDSTGGAKVQGWIVKPPTFEKTKQYPLVLEIHGGPHGMYNVAFNFMFQSFAAKGYVVLYTNPRGSTGYGSAFGNAIERAYPSVDYDDLMAGVDATLAKGFVDSRNMFVGGCSGGGVLSSWVIGHTDRFAAAAVRCPVTNWLSFQGHTDIPFFTANFFDAPFWEKPEQWLKQSPLMYVGNVKTPTLLMTGVLDMRTPMPQTEEYYTALKMRGVPTKLLRFEGEYHGTSSKPSNFMRTILYMDEWYKEHRRSGPAPTQALR